MPDNTDSIIDSRDIIDRIAELEQVDELDDDETDELATLRELASQCENYSDWRYGAVLVRGTYFEQHARDEADALGLVEDTLSWPFTHINWAAAADDLQNDYTEVDFDGVEYWIRS